MEAELVGGLEHLAYFSIQLGIVTPTDELIFFRGVQTTNQRKIAGGLKFLYYVNIFEYG